METITYKYSAFRTVFVTLLLLAFAILLTYGAIKTTGDDRMLTIVGVLVLIGALFYVCKGLLFPMLRSEAILEIDAEKLQYALKDLTLYWKDIDDLDYDDSRFSNSKTFKVSFTMKETGSNVRMSTWFIAGDNKAIFVSILDTFLRYK